jgi:hypothetical protein
MVMMFNATLNNISVKLWQSVLLVEETGVPRNLEKKEKKYSSKFFNNFHLSESSFTCPGSGKWVSAKTAL